MRIKIIKLFAALCPLEPRLAKKLADPLTELIHSTPAMSLLYECIITVLTGMPEDTAAIQVWRGKVARERDKPLVRIKDVSALSHHTVVSFHFLLCTALRAEAANLYRGRRPEPEVPGPSGHDAGAEDCAQGCDAAPVRI